MNSRAAVALVLMLGAAVQAQEAQKELVCDPLHPGYFTYIQERRNLSGLQLTTTFDLYEPFGRSKGEPLVSKHEDFERAVFMSQKKDMPPCMQNETFVPGRFSIAERSEVIISFEPGLVHRLTGHLGRLDVKGQIVSGSNARAIEIPGYQEIGKAVPPTGVQFDETESLVASVLLILRASDEFDRAWNELQQHETQKRTARSEPDAGTVLDAPERREDWTNRRLLEHEEVYRAAFQEILDHADVLVMDGGGESGRNTALSQIVSIAQVGKSLLADARRSSEAMNARIAEGYRRLEQDQVLWFFRQAADAATMRASGKEPQANLSDPWRICLPGRQFRSYANQWCGDARLNRACELMFRANDQVCTLPRKGEKAPDWAKLATDLRAEMSHVLDTVEARATERGARLASWTPVQRWEEARQFAVDHQEWEGTGRVAEELTQIAPPSPYVGALAREFESLKKRVPRDEDWSPFMDSLIAKLRWNIAESRKEGFREIRLQPRIIDAHAGDVIEVTITYVPPGAPAAGTTSATAQRPETASNVASDGRTRSGSWTLRFLVDRIGWYVSAGPRLSLNFSRDYQPDARTFRGTNGTLAVGAGVDLLHMPGSEVNPVIRAITHNVCGIGFRVDQLDFDSAQAIELGIEGHLLLFKGIASVGFGINTSVSREPFDRRVYWSIGLGLERILDEALRIAEEEKR